MSGYRLYQWMKRYAKPAEQRQQDDDLQAENRRLKAELKRISEERDRVVSSSKRIYGLLPACKASG
ncbi:hypothetical protein BTW10_02590 [Chromohalobacter japonicus]|uniref:Transposase n=1 Tax=Chromohalobacter japonicus TaxID=223900 RepID=A0A1Q8TFE6_9GAMM|nr:hypothetical protein BTW10_02590 [Chromohalobacter japonicus]